MIKLGGLVTLNPFVVTEGEDDKYTHIGYGKFKQKGKEKDTNAPTFTKDDSGKYVAAGSDDSKSTGDKSEPEKPKVNIFDKPKKEPKKQEPTKTDSTGTRAGNPKINKMTYGLASKLGYTPQKLGKEGYKKLMSQAAVEALVDANYSDEARKLVAVLEDNPELAKDPMLTQPEGGFSNPKYKDWRATTAWGSEFMDADSGVSSFVNKINSKTGWDPQDTIDGIAYSLKMNGNIELANKIQSILENRKSVSLKDIIGESILASKEIAHYTGTRETAVSEFIKKYNIDGDKLAVYVRKGKMKARMNFVSALAGNPGNNVQKWIIKKFGK